MHSRCRPAPPARPAGPRRPRRAAVHRSGAQRAVAHGHHRAPQSRGLYLCAVKDVCSGRIVGYSIDARMTSSLAVAAPQGYDAAGSSRCSRRCAWAAWSSGATEVDRARARRSRRPAQWDAGHRGSGRASVACRVLPHRRHVAMAIPTKTSAARLERAACEAEDGVLPEHCFCSPTSAAGLCTTPSSAWTRRSHWSATCCLRCCRASARDRAWC